MGPDDRSVRLAQVEDLPDVARPLDQFNRESLDFTRHERGAGEPIMYVYEREL